MMPEHWTTAYRPIAWAMRIPGCDGSADWAELGEDQPAPNAPAVASPLYDKDGLDRAVAADRERCAHEVDVALGYALEDGYSVEAVQAIMGVRDMLRGPNVVVSGAQRPLHLGWPLVWTGARQPDSFCRYTHCIALTPFGRFLITWKGWKDGPLPTLDETPWGDWSGDGWGSVADAQAACEKEFARRLAECLAA